VSAPRGLRAALLAGLLPVLLVACGDSGRNLKSYEPGVYKGATDPLVELQRTPEHQQKLRERFTKGQER
jgi:hypothetical protein